MTLTVLAVGAQATVQDLGRPGHADLGVPIGGAGDREALRAANRAVGNRVDAAALELLLGGLEVQTDSAAILAVTGAPSSVWRNAVPVPFGESFAVRPGDRVRIGTPVIGLRSYLAVRGGLRAARLYGSASTNPTADLGPAPLAPGDRWEVADGAGNEPTLGFSPTSTVHPPQQELTVRVVRGPRDDWFTPQALNRLTASRWETTAEADRVGIRLAGATLERARSGELASEAMVRGAIQVPASGQPIVFGPDHPTTGGYPVIGVVVDADLDQLWQARPGTGVRFRTVPPSW